MLKDSCLKKQMLTMLDIGMIYVLTEADIPSSIINVGTSMYIV